MSFNPTRINGNQPIRPHSPPLGSGVSHSQILKKYRGSSSAPMGDRKPTRHGYQVHLFESPAFVTRYEVLFPKNNTGLGLNPSGDRTIMVVRGSVFGTVKNPEGTFDSFKLGEQQYLHLPRGTEYGLATSGVDGAELYVTETPNYEATWQQTADATMDITAPIPMSPQASPTLVKRGVDPITMAQAQAIAQQSGDLRRRAAQRSSQAEFANANSANVLGVNPRPGGIPSSEE